MTQILRRFNRAAEKIEDERKLARILLETGADAPPATFAGASLPGDTRKLRGIPAIGRGVTGAVPGSIPHKLAA